ncbi:hypothetical protein ILUMI_14562 [Ignelater luminosus]|uniref:Integrase catalytic domain-containing protein n=1 Tax=Ignelater luminosus TaxID=2038154 RepID=A0A8K0CUP1_IGNLU|nr:hypothetical protein ILUMI_14562 [Ignelater luminosus]
MTSREFKQYCQDTGIKLGFSPPYSPQSNSLVKLAVQACKRMLPKSVFNNSRNKDDILTGCVFSYRAAPSSVTSVSPMVTMLTYTSKFSVSVSSPANESQVEVKPKSILKVRVPEFSEGKRVWVNVKNVKGHDNWLCCEGKSW